MITLSNEISEIVEHYSSQIAQQLHVLILGLDVLGNPYALVSDFTEGFGDLFYEPPFVSFFFCLLKEKDTISLKNLQIV